MQTIKRLGLGLAAAFLMTNTAGCLVMLDDGPPHPHWDDEHEHYCSGQWYEDDEHWYGDCGDVDSDNNETPDAPGPPGDVVGDPDAPCDAPDPSAVCGEDGVTYMTPCDASRAHVRVAYTGACKQACTEDAACGAGELCEAGFCEEVTCPELADDDFSQEVCGNDDFTYKSACEARMSRVGVQHDGCCI